MATKRRTRRSADKKVYVVRDKEGKFKDIQTYKSSSFVWRDDSGRFHEVTVADPLVRPRGVTVEQIRKAVGKSGGGSRRKKK